MSLHGYSVDKTERGYAVFQGRKQVSGSVGYRWLAEEQRDKLIRQGKGRDRSCMTCGKTFRSEGRHNRMCDGCRKSARSIA